mmetsp:Transcript_31336/g.89960  ORF Transcript_31336/g.89960 Transcript_31336/m.89960 type:complete len:102 (-) Transcript_31336:215-520(-)
MPLYELCTDYVLHLVPSVPCLPRPCCCHGGFGRSKQYRLIACPADVMSEEACDSRRTATLAVEVAHGSAHCVPSLEWLSWRSLTGAERLRGLLHARCFHDF